MMLNFWEKWVMGEDCVG